MTAALRRTYLDSCVIIAAVRGNRPASKVAMEILEDQGRELVSSRAVELEVVPAPLVNGFQEQAELTKHLLSKVVESLAMSDEIFGEAVEEASRTPGLIGLDAIHAVAARKLNAELVTAESDTSGYSRVAGLSTLFLTKQPLTS